MNPYLGVNILESHLLSPARVEWADFGLSMIDQFKRWGFKFWRYQETEKRKVVHGAQIIWSSDMRTIFCHPRTAMWIRESLVQP